MNSRGCATAIACAIALCVLCLLQIAADTPAYASHMSAIAQLAEEQHQLFIEDAWLLPAEVEMNPAMEDWPYDHRPNTVIIAWYIGYFSTMYMLMDIGPHRSDWKVVRPVDSIELLSDHSGRQRAGLIALDPRIFTFNRHLHIEHYRYADKNYFLYSDVLYRNSSLQALYAVPPLGQLHIEHEMGSIPQKNWAAFEYHGKHNHHHANSSRFHHGHHGGRLLFVYSINPHRIVSCSSSSSSFSSCHGYGPHSMNMTTVAVSEYVPSPSFPELWRHGEPRGGSPAKLLDTPYGVRYLTFFHSQYFNRSTGMSTYFMGAYLFEAQPPFAMTHIMPDVLACRACLSPAHGLAYKVLDYILFPMGFVVRGEHIYMSYGRNDRSGWVMRLRRTAFLRYLRPVSTRTIS